ncbi:MAG: serine--tRNA ligase, partial [Candidatus Competibacteraceae bacterium]|nr:serine--tRNA ligase [Candidatus Competibacteraceae bacterium]
MLDIKLLRDDPERIATNLRDRGVRVFDDLSGDDWPAQTVARLQGLEQRYRELWLR